MWNQKEFESVYNRYKLSGLQVKDFCSNEGIYQSKFYYWRKKRRDQQQEADQPSGFCSYYFQQTANAHKQYHLWEQTFKRETAT